MLMQRHVHSLHDRGGSKSNHPSTTFLRFGKVSNLSILVQLVGSLLKFLLAGGLADVLGLDWALVNMLGIVDSSPVDESVLTGVALWSMA